ncbi:MAG: GAF domain-containing protein [Roseibium sp.]|uniref:GAF domain-containing protein n=1 Tax=Roseibium sp. TaxID=1936156 RepID=UPI003265593A
MAIADTTASHVEAVASTVHNSVNATTSVVAASWRRSMVYYGLDPARRSVGNRTTHHELVLAREENGSLLEIARPNLQRLFQTAGKAGCCVALTNADGLILEVNSTEADRRNFEEWGLTEGALWNEANEGTNGIGTCLAENRPVIIFQNQHFRAQNTAMSCMGAPIYDHSGEITAVLDISSCRTDLTASFAQVLGSVVTDSARAVESDLFRSAFPEARIVVAEGHGASGVSLLAVDEDDLLVGATRLARRNLGITSRTLAEMPSLGELVGGRVAAARDLARAEKTEIRRAIAHCKGNVAAAARDLGISRATMYRRMKQHGLLSER